MNFALKSLRTRAVLASSKERCVVPCASRANASSFVDSATDLLSSAEPLLGNAIALASAVGAAAYAFRSVLREANADRAKEFGILTETLRADLKKDVLLLDTRLSGDLKSTTEKLSGDLKSTTEKLSGDLKSTTEKLSGDLKSTTEKLSGDLKSTTEKIDIKMTAIIEGVAKDVSSVKEGVAKDMSGDLKSTTEKIDIKMAALKELVAKEVDAKIAGVSDKAKAEALMVLKDYGVSTSFLFRACRRRATCLTCSFSIPLVRSLSRVARQAFRARTRSTLEGTEGARGRGRN